MKKIGILGGGQLGKMFIQNAVNYPVEIHILDPDENCSCKNLASSFTQGNFNDKQTVLDFAENLDVVGIEIEHVNTEALKELEKQGKTVVPSPDLLEVFQDKGFQKEFYSKNHLPTAPFYLIENGNELNLNKIQIPFVQKLRKGGYDGKGVQIIKSEEEIINVWNEPSVIEQCADIDKELAVIFAKNKNGEIAIFPTVEMVFNPELNLVDYLFSPAQTSSDVETEIQNIIKQFAHTIKSSGIFAVELFLNKNGSIWINETAPRVHNSGHATIEGNYLSQYDIMLRSLLNLPFASVENRCYSAMVNLIGAKENQGESYIKNIDKLTILNKTYLHWYGKKITKPGRKMGHVSVLGNSKEELEEKINFIKEHISVKAK
ncbi:MAG: 5-(carboxyamino)imidazole ribonucleotide synthase [Flavobacteriales bacterium]|nr:5-(carboxyamino)imidazole ribonucleotide synthase [Flavobacteriales bacterium]